MNFGALGTPPKPRFLEYVFGSSSSGIRLPVYAPIGSRIDFDFNLRESSGNPSAGVSFFFNDDTSAANYLVQATSATNTTLSTSVTNASFIASLDPNGFCQGTGTILVSSDRISWTSRAVRFAPGVGFSAVSYDGYYNTVPLTP